MKEYPRNDAQKFKAGLGTSQFYPRSENGVLRCDLDGQVTDKKNSLFWKCLVQRLKKKLTLLVNPTKPEDLYLHLINKCGSKTLQCGLTLASVSTSEDIVQYIVKVRATRKC